MICKNCHKEVKENAKFCPFCGDEIMQGFREGSDEYKKIKNAGSTAEALGWFNLTLGLLYIIATDVSEGNDPISIFINIIYVIGISFTYIKFGKRVKKVNNISIKDLNVLLFTTWFVIVINLLGSLSGGKFMGILFIFELIYLFKAKSILKRKLSKF